MKSNRVKILVIVALLVCAGVIGWRWWGGDSVARGVDPAIVEAAAEASRAAREKNPPPVEEPPPPAGSFAAPMMKK